MLGFVSTILFLLDSGIHIFSFIVPKSSQSQSGKDGNPAKVADPNEMAKTSAAIET